MKTVNEIAQEHGVHPSQVAQWKRAIQEQAGALFEAKRGPQPLDARSDPDRLCSEIGCLMVELNWLKKCLVYGDSLFWESQDDNVFAESWFFYSILLL